MNGVELGHGESTPVSSEELEELNDEYSRRSEAEEIEKLQLTHSGKGGEMCTVHRTEALNISSLVATSLILHRRRISSAPFLGLQTPAGALPTANGTSN